MRKDHVFLSACLGCIGGVWIGSFFVVAWWGVALLFAVWGALMLAFPRRNTALLAFPIILFVCGILSVTDAADRFREEKMRVGAVSGIARIVNDPEERDFYRHVILRMASCENAYCPEEKILWQAPRMTELVPGSRILFSCALEPPKNFDQAFDYRMFLAKDDIGYVCRKASRAAVVPEDLRARMTRLFFMPKRAFEGALERSLPQPEAGLAEGLILGGDHRLPETLRQTFVTAGLSHIVAISGYNIALIAQGFVIFGVGIGLWRRQALWFAAFGIILFILLVGAPASAIRAGIMGLCAFAALFAGRLSLSVNMLLFAATLMLLFQPLLLRYDVGFQLSFLAALAIIVALPLIELMLPREIFGRTFMEIALLTFAVELFVVPILVYQFHSFSPFALIANTLLLPLVPYAMFTTFAGGLAFLILPGLHLLPIGISYLFLRGITFSAEQISGWPGAAIGLSIGVKELFLWYICLFFAIVAIKRHFRSIYVQTKNIS